MPPKKGLLLPGPGVSLDKTEASYLKTTSFSKSLPLKVYAGLSLINDREDFFCDNLEVDTLFIDEGFGTLDADNLSSLFMMMQYLKTQFDFIWVISHLEQMRDIVDGLIEIKKVDGFSKINF